MIGTVYPVIKSPQKAIGVVLGIGLIAVIGADDFLRISFAIAVRIAEEPENRGLGNEKSAADVSDGAGHEKIIGEDGVSIHAAVVIGVGEECDSAEALVFAATFDIGHVSAHFQDVEIAGGIELNFDGCFDLRFAGDDFDFEAGLETKRFERLFDTEGRRGGNLQGGRRRGLDFAGFVAALSKKRKRRENKGPDQLHWRA